jgi:uncharacterized coiled-coil protein SlyX
MEALKKLARLVYSCATMDNNESVNVGVHFLRELVASTDELEKQREMDVVDQEAERAIQKKMIEHLSVEMARRTQELQRAEAALDSMYLALDRMADRWSAWQRAGELTLVNMVLDFSSVLIAEHLKWTKHGPDSDDRPTTPPAESTQATGGV